MKQPVSRKRVGQVAVVIFGAIALKQFYALASANQLRWILGPTTFLVELVTGSRFAFESHAGYLSNDGSFVIAGSCAGVNFLITAFLMLALRKLWQDRSAAWISILQAALLAYATTLVANTVRISTAISLRHTALEIGGFSRSQLHRGEGIVIFFGFLLLLFLLSEKLVVSTRERESDLYEGKVSYGSQHPERSRSLLRQAAFPLLLYYATTLGIPLANACLRTGPAAPGLWEHVVFVLLTPLLFIPPVAVFRSLKRWSIAATNSRPEPSA
jgi:exosortase K